LRVAAHNLSYFFLAKVVLKHGLRQDCQLGGVQADIDRAIEIGAESDVVHANQINRITNSSNNSVWCDVTDRCLPETDAEQAAVRGNLEHEVVSKISRRIADTFEPTVRENLRPVCYFEDVANGLRRYVRDVDDDSELIGAPYHLATEVGEPGF